MGGTDAIPRQWSDPIGSGIVLHKFTGPIDAPRNVAELRDRTAAMAERFSEAESARVAFGDERRVPEDLMSILYENEQAEAATARDVRCAVARDRDAEIMLHYHGGPVFEPGVARRLSVSCRRPGAGPVRARVRLAAPADWHITEIDEQRFRVTPPRFDGIQRLGVEAEIGGERYSAEYAVLSPSEASGFPSLGTVAHCPVCQGRAGSCVCSDAR
jgi:hypothetical protein